jgi:hypothetical protein
MMTLLDTFRLFQTAKFAPRERNHGSALLFKIYAGAAVRWSVPPFGSVFALGSVRILVGSSPVEQNSLERLTMVRLIFKSGLAVACLLAISVFVPRANAGSVDFACGAPATNACTGTVTASGSGGFTTTGIGLQSSFDGTDMFTATFTTDSSGAGSISISDTNGDAVSGTIVATTMSTFGDDETLTFDVNWTSLSSSVQAALGGTSGIGESTVEFSISSSGVNSADLHLGSGGTGPHPPVPEPSTLVLLGTGLLGVGFAFRRISLA